MLGPGPWGSSLRERRRRLGRRELIRSLDRARTQLVRLEQLSHDELAEIEDEFRRVRSEHS